MMKNSNLLTDFQSKSLSYAMPRLLDISLNWKLDVRGENENYVYLKSENIELYLYEDAFEINTSRKEYVEEDYDGIDKLYQNFCKLIDNMQA